MPPADSVTPRAPAGGADRQSDAAVRSLPAEEGFRVPAAELKRLKQKWGLALPAVLHGEGALAVQADYLGGGSAGQQRADPAGSRFSLHAEDVPADAEAGDVGATWRGRDCASAAAAAPVRLKRTSTVKYIHHTHRQTHTI